MHFAGWTDGRPIPSGRPDPIPNITGRESLFALVQGSRRLRLSTRLNVTRDSASNVCINNSTTWLIGPRAVAEEPHSKLQPRLGLQLIIMWIRQVSGNGSLLFSASPKLVPALVPALITGRKDEDEEMQSPDHQVE